MPVADRLPRSLGGLDRRRRLDEQRRDLGVTGQERLLVKPAPAHPRGDLVVALARVARATRRRDVVQRVAAAAREREDAVALERRLSRTAVGAPTPRRLQCSPLLGAQVVLDALHAALALA